MKKLTDKLDTMEAPEEEATDLEGRSTGITQSEQQRERSRN